MKKILLNPWTALITLSIMVMLRIWDPSFVESVRLRYFDQLITKQPDKPVPVNIVHIDEDSLDKYGQFPFPRDIYADIIEELYKRDAGIVVLNIMMPEKDRFRKDKILSQTFEQNQVVLPNLGSIKNKNTPPYASATIIGNDPAGRVVEYPGLINNIDILTKEAAGVGMVNTFPEIDGVVRRTPLVIYSQGELYPSLALESLRVISGDRTFQIKIGEIGVEALRIPAFGKISTDSLGRIWIDWSVKPKEFSLVNLPKSFNKEVVVVGVSAAGLVQPVATSAGEVWPQTVQAISLGTMITGSTIQRPDWSDTAELGLLISASVMLLFLTRHMYIGIATMLVFSIGATFASFYIYEKYLFLIDATAFIATIILVALHAYTVKFMTEFFQKQQIRKQFSTYLSPDLVAKLVKDPDLLQLGGEEKELSIMFTDVRGFTSISEHYGRDVQGLTKIMNRYMTAMTKTILETGGTLDKYIGDAQMAFWNAPLDETIHCKDSVKAALEMLDNLKKFNDEIAIEGTPPFGMGIGINTGVVVVGNMGSEQRFDYTCLGDAVNLASRLEGQSKNYGVLIVLGPVTAERLGDEYFTIQLDCIAVKGKKEGVNIYTVFYNPTNAADLVKWKEHRRLHDLMLDSYRKQDWDKAISLVESLKGCFDNQMDNYYEIWIDRINDMRRIGLPSDWDGVFRAQSK